MGSVDSDGRPAGKEWAQSTAPINQLVNLGSVDSAGKPAVLQDGFSRLVPGKQLLLCHQNYVAICLPQSALDALEGGGNLTIPKMRQRFIFTLNDSQQSLILSKLCVTSTADFVKFKTAIGPAISADKVNA